MTKPKIRLGICMAGAVSAGAYTAGVIDYIIETLERWDRAKIEIDRKIEALEPLTEKEKLIPNYDVVIEVLSGASAGGMTAAILSYSLLDDQYLTKRDNELINESYDLPNWEDSKTKLYQSWVEMVDDNKESTFDKMMDNSNVKAITEMNSLLNNKAIDEIANNALPSTFPSTINFPNYISPDLSVFLTVTNLEGLPIEIKFGNTDETRNQFKIHSGFLHYNFSDKTYPNFDYPNQKITKSNYHNLLKAAKSTGAFPFGFENQKVSIGNEFMQAYKDNLYNQYKIDIDNSAFKGKDYEFTAVDGGLINNEPIGTTQKFLNGLSSNNEEKKKNYLLLIDPFPNITNADKIERPKPIKEKYNMLELALKLFGAVRNQSMFKQEDLLESLEMKNNKYLIYPSQKGRYFLACGEIGGFSGFLKKAFRMHDYQLGKKNAQSFLSYYFGENESALQDIGIHYTTEQSSFWGYYPKKDDTKALKLPLIPDLLWLQQNIETGKYDKKRGEEIKYPEYNGLTINEFAKIKDKISERVKSIIDKSFHLLYNNELPWCVKAGLYIFKSIIKNGIKEKIMSTLEKFLFNTFKPQLLKQVELVDKYSVLIQKKGIEYIKYKGVYATKAIGREFIESITSDGFETRGIASAGQYILTNDTTAREQYIVKEHKFINTYELVEEPNYYKKKKNVSVIGLEFNAKNFPEMIYDDKQSKLNNKTIYIETDWKESQVLKEGDMLVLSQENNHSEIYRIAKKEFNETYKLV